MKKKLMDGEAAAGSGTVSQFAIDLAETVGKEVVCAEKGAAEAFLTKLKTAIDAESFGLKKEVEKWGVNEALNLLSELEVACGCPDTQS